MHNRYEYDINPLDDKYGLPRTYTNLEDCMNDIKMNNLPVEFNDTSTFELFTDNEGFVFKTDNLFYYGFNKLGITDSDNLYEGYVKDIHIFIYKGDNYFRIFEVIHNTIKESTVWKELDEHGRVRVRTKLGSTKISMKNLIKNFKEV